MPNHACAALDEMGVDYFEAEGEAASSTDQKLDIQVKTALGKEETLRRHPASDLLPERFDLNTLGPTGKNTVQSWSTVGYFNHGALHSYLDWELPSGAFPTWLV